MTNTEKAGKLKDFLRTGVTITPRAVSKARNKYGALYLALMEEKGKEGGDTQMVESALAIINAGD